MAADGLRRLTEFSARAQVNVIVENHGGLSSNGAWLAGVIREGGPPAVWNAARFRELPHQRQS